MPTTFHEAAEVASTPVSQPWTIEHTVAARPSIVAAEAGCNGTLIAHVFAFDRDTGIHNIAQAITNARFIVQACKSHAALVAAVQEFVDDIEGRFGEIPEDCVAYHMGTDVLADLDTMTVVVAARTGLMRTALLNVAIWMRDYLVFDDTKPDYIAGTRCEYASVLHALAADCEGSAIIDDPTSDEV